MFFGDDRESRHDNDLSGKLERKETIYMNHVGIPVRRRYANSSWLFKATSALAITRLSLCRKKEQKRKERKGNDKFNDAHTASYPRPSGSLIAVIAADIWNTKRSRQRSPLTLPLIERETSACVRENGMMRPRRARSGSH